MSATNQPNRIPNDTAGAYWALAIHTPRDVATAASQSGLSPVYIEDYQAMGWSHEPRWAVLDASREDPSSELATFATLAEAEAFAEATFKDITGWGPAPDLIAGWYPTQVSQWITAEVATTIQRRTESDVVQGASQVRESLTAFGVPVDVDVDAGLGGPEAHLHVNLAPHLPLVIITVRADAAGPTYRAEVLDEEPDAPPVGEWDLNDAHTTALLARLAWFGPDAVESTRHHLGLPEASIADLAVAIAADPMAGDPWSGLHPGQVEPAVTVYTSEGCVACKATKRHLDKAGVPYTEVDVRTDLAALDRLKAMGYLELPVVADGAEHWSGYRPDRVAALAARHARPTPPPTGPALGVGVEGPGV